MRPLCKACQQRVCAVNYRRKDKTHYRSRCENCIRKGRGLAKRKSLWEQSGYRKQKMCDRCGFRAKYSAQLIVYHVDGRMDNTDLKNLKTVCRNCQIEIDRSDLTWRPGDLEPDR